MAKKQMKINPMLKKVLIVTVVIGTLLALIIPIKIKVASFYINKGNSNVQNHYYKSAINNYEKASVLSPNNASLKIQLGNIYNLYKDKETAMNYFEEATNIDKNNEEAWILLLEALLENKDLEKASQKIVEMPKILLDNLAIKINYARVLANISRLAEAQEIISISIEDESKFYQTIFYLAQSDYENAKKIFEDVPQRNSLGNKYKIVSYSLEKINNHTSLLYKKIIAAQTFNDIDEPYLAEQLLLKILETNSTYRDANIFLGYSYILQKKPDKSLEYLEKAKNQDKIYGITYYFIGEAYNTKGDLENTKTNLEKAINFGYETIDIFELLAITEKDLKNYGSAEKYYRKIIELEKNEKAYQGLVEILVEQTKVDDSLKIAEESKNDVLIGYVYTEKNELARAKEYLDRYENNNPYSPLGSFISGNLYQKENNTEKAKEYYLKTIEIDTTGIWAKKSENRLSSL